MRALLAGIRSFRAQFLIALALTGILPMAVAGIVVLALNGQALRDQSSRELIGLARGLAGEVDLYVAGRLSDARVVAALPQISGMDPSQQTLALRSIFLDYSRFAQIGVYDSAGRRVAAARPDGAMQAAISGAFAEALRGQQGWEIAAGAAGGGPYLWTAVPIRDSSRRITGVLATSSDLADLSVAANQTLATSGGRAMLFDAAGRELLGADPGADDSSAAAWLQLGRVRPAGPGTVAYSRAGLRYVASYAPVASVGWVIMVEEPEANVLAPLLRPQWIGMGALAVSLLLSVLAAVLAARRLTLPLRQLAVAAQAFGRGNANAPLPKVAAADMPAASETDQLVRAFADMREAVSAALVRERAEQALSAAVLLNAPAGLMVLAPDLRVISANPAAARLFGSVPDSLVGESLASAVADDLHVLSATSGFGILFGLDDASIVGRRLGAVLGNLNLSAGIGQNAPWPSAVLERAQPEQLVRVAVSLIQPAQQAVARSLLVTIEDLTELSRIKSRYAELQTLQSIALTILRTSDLGVITGEILDQALAISGFDLGAVRLYVPDRHVLAAISHRGYRQTTSSRLDPEVSGEQAAFSATLQVADASLVTGFGGFKAEGARTIIVVPVQAEGALVGTIELASRSPRTVAEVDVRVLEAIGSQIGLAIQKARLYDDATLAYATLKRTEEALRASEIEARKLSLVASRTDNAVIIAGADRRIEWVNEGFTRITGYSFGEALGKSPAQLLQGPLSDPATVAHMRDKLARGEGYNVEIINYRKTGEPYWIAVEVQPIRDADGNVVQYMALESDITQRKEAERRLKLSANILESIGNFVLVANSRGEVVYVSPSARKILGYEPHELLGEGWWTVDRGHTNAEEKAAERDYIRRAAAGEIPIDGHPYEHYTRRKDGERRWLMLSDAKGPEDLIIGVGNDITERKQAEHELQLERDFALQVMNTMGQGLTITDISARFEFVNAAYASMLGYNADELVGKTPFDFTLRQDQAALAAAREARKLGETSVYESRLQARDGSTVYVLVTAVPRWRDGQVAGAIAVITNLTERKRMEEAVAQARDEALEASRQKSDFLAMMSHEIRTPMNGIIGTSELLLVSPLSDEQREFAQIVRDESFSLLRILNDILDFSKIEAGRVIIDEEEFDLARLVVSVLGLHEADALRKGLALTANIDPVIPVGLVSDRGRVRQVLGNLVSNAIKFTERGSVTVRVTADEVTPERVTVRIEVADTGIGIAPAVQAGLFQPFMQADSSVTRKFGGTGLGLVICKRLAELMGGSIGLVSTPGTGSTFWVTLPCARAPVARSVAPARASKPAPLGAKNGVVLVVEDNLANQKVALGMLAELGYHAEVAGNGQAALDAVCGTPEKYALVLMDVQMPVMDGLTATAKIRTWEREHGRARLPIVAFTANAVPSEAQRCLAAGMDGYLSKPVTLADLADALQQRAG